MAASRRADKVAFTIRADQFPVTSITDVPSTVRCYLSGLTNPNTIPTGARTHANTHAHTQKKKQVMRINPKPSGGRTRDLATFRLSKEEGKLSS